MSLYVKGDWFSCEKWGVYLIPFEVDETFMLKESGKNKGGVIDSFSRWRKKHRKKEQKNS